MNDQILRCRKCGISDAVDIRTKGTHHTAYCARCGAYIKHLPTQEPMLYFGKYNRTPIKDIEDVDYLQWVLKKVKVSASTRTAIKERIQSLQLTHL